MLVINKAPIQLPTIIILLLSFCFELQFHTAVKCWRLLPTWCKSTWPIWQIKFTRIRCLYFFQTNNQNNKLCLICSYRECRSPHRRELIIFTCRPIILASQWPKAKFASNQQLATSTSNYGQRNVQSQFEILYNFAWRWVECLMFRNWIRREMIKTFPSTSTIHRGLLIGEMFHCLLYTMESYIVHFLM